MLCCPKMRPNGVKGLRSEPKSGVEVGALVLAAKMLEAVALVLVVEVGNTSEEKGEAVRLDSRFRVGVDVSLSLSATPPNKLERLGRSLVKGKGVLPIRDARSMDLDGPSD